ncbi:Tetratricopeptide repeat-containing protein [Roseateles sp. YR242]|nr:Tetratricopeptide repeat-containing protein [Roseateles sp. YR242]
MAMSAVDMLEAGQEDQARAEIQRALALDSTNKLANSLMRQITGDPAQMLGRESFSYTVRPNDTLSRIAGRFMGDIYSFYILARYNDIKVPSRVAGGQVLRIPGKAPPPGSLDPQPAPRGRNTPAPAPVVAPPPAVQAPAPVAAPAPAPSPAPAPELSPGEKAMRNAESWERSNRLDRALDEYKRAASLEQPGAQAKVDAVRKKLIDRYTLAARTAFAKQDLAGSIKAWDNVLELDPNNELAKLERQKAVALKAKVDQLK